MKFDEKKAMRWLESQGNLDFQFEPDGNIPPDFVLNKNIGIEVRRLNQHVHLNDKNVPLEILEFNLIPKIEKLLKQIKKEEFSNSIFLSIRYERPLRVDKKLLTLIKTQILLNIELLEKDLTFNINDHLELRLFKSDKKLKDYIQVGSMSDRDSGGFVVREIYKNLIIIIKEKEEKILKYKNRYEFWWLLLIDHIGYELSDLDIQQLNDLPLITTFFDRIVLISPNNNNKSWDLIIKKSYA
jgi:hypothetical protein